MIGGRFDRLVVLSRAENYGSQRQWLCQCDCGNTTVVRTGHLTNGAVKSCGCGQHRGKWVGGSSYDREHSTWTKMRRRCNNPKDRAYPRYGGAGITVCPEWNASFSVFIRDMGKCPDGMTLDRIDNNKGYGPENCRWATYREQRENQARVSYIECNGERKLLIDWARTCGAAHETLRWRLKHWDTYTALHAAPGYNYRRLGPMKLID